MIRSASASDSACGKLNYFRDNSHFKQQVQISLVRRCTILPKDITGCVAGPGYAAIFLPCSNEPLPLLAPMHKTSLRKKPPDAWHRTASIPPGQETESLGGVWSCKGKVIWLKSLSSPVRQAAIRAHAKAGKRSCARLETGERRTEALRCPEADQDGVGKKLICSLRQVCIIRSGIIGFNAPEADLC